MLKKWSIENFKSFHGRTEIDLGAISVFAGANSSGKSTIIQSILLLKQTVQYAAVTRPLALNGPLLKLGTFDDVKNVASDANYIEISWQLDVDPVQATGPALSIYGYPSPQYFYSEQKIGSVAGRFRWDKAPVADRPTRPFFETSLLQFCA